jgi:hypothetical protein
MFAAVLFKMNEPLIFLIFFVRCLFLNDSKEEQKITWKLLNYRYPPTLTEHSGVGLRAPCRN